MRAAWWWALVVAWAALIFTLSSIPDLGTGLGGWDLVLRKLAHGAEFAVLGFLLVPGRLGSPVDVAIDAAGVAVGVFLARHYHWGRGR